MFKFASLAAAIGLALALLAGPAHSLCEEPTVKGQSNSDVQGFDTGATCTKSEGVDLVNSAIEFQVLTEGVLVEDTDPTPVNDSLMVTVDGNEVVDHSD